MSIKKSKKKSKVQRVGESKKKNEKINEKYSHYKDVNGNALTV